MTESLFETGYFPSRSVVFGFRPESRLATWADLFECALFFKRAVFFGAQQFHQPSRYGLRHLLRSGKKHKHQDRYVDLIEAVISDVMDSNTSSYSGAPRLWRMTTNETGTCTDIKMVLEDKILGHVDDSYYRTVRVRHTPEREEEYYRSAYYRKYGTGTFREGAHPTGVTYHTTTDEISFVFGFSRQATLLHDLFSALAIGVLRDAGFVSTWIRRVVATHTPELVNDVAGLEVQTEMVAGDTVRVSTNIDVQKIVKYHIHVAPDRFPGARYDEFGDIDEIATHEDILYWLLNPLLWEIECLVRTCVAEATLYHDTSELEGLRLLRQTSAEREICRFVDAVVGEAGSVREKIISGEARPMQLLKLYERSDRWRQWTSQIGNDGDLVRDYIREIGSDPWIAKLPAKTLRFVATTGAGVAADVLGAGGIGTATAIGIGALDQFLIERLAAGYTPREFINRMAKT